MSCLLLEYFYGSFPTSVITTRIDCEDKCFEVAKRIIEAIKSKGVSSNGAAEFSLCVKVNPCFRDYYHFTMECQDYSHDSSVKAGILMQSVQRCRKEKEETYEKSIEKHEDYGK